MRAFRIVAGHVASRTDRGHVGRVDLPAIELKGEGRKGDADLCRFHDELVRARGEIDRPRVSPMLAIHERFHARLGTCPRVSMAVATRDLGDDPRGA